MLIVPDESLALQRVVVNAMSRYTFAIIQPSTRGVENQEVSTGVGVQWKGTYLILTAGHVVEHCAEDRLRFFLPAKDIQYLPAQPPKQPINVEVRRLTELENPKPPVLADDADLAAIILPPQPRANDYFFRVQPDLVPPTEGTEMGVLGYPAAVKTPIGKDFAASPVSFYGRFDSTGVRCDHPPIQDFTVPYELDHRANGFSGSGIWHWSIDPLWTPEARLAGIVTTECVPHKVVCGHNLETVRKFLTEKESLIRAAYD